LLSSPSQDLLLSALIAYGISAGDGQAFQESWGKTIRALLFSSIGKERKEAGVIHILKSTPTTLHGKLPFISELESYVINKLRANLEANEVAGWEMIKFAIHSSGTP
jgi:hypothetical protein